MTESVRISRRHLAEKQKVECVQFSLQSKRRGGSQETLLNAINGKG